MNLSLHKEYSEITINKLYSSTDDLNKIRDGCFANDLCQFTNEYVYLLNIRDSLFNEISKVEQSKLEGSIAKYFIKGNLVDIEHQLLTGANSKLTMRSEKALLDYFPFYQSHFGKLAALHSMAHIDSIPAKGTHRKVLKWLNLLQLISKSTDQNILNKKAPTFPLEGENLSPNLNFTLSRLLDTSEIKIARFRAIGMILHIIHDSFTKSHCRRNPRTLKIESYHCFKSQSISRHTKEDENHCDLENEMLKICSDVTEKLVDQNPVDFEQYFELSNTTEPSSDGGYGRA